MSNIPESLGSKYRYILIAGQRVAQLQKGARPRIDGHHLKYTEIATQELDEDKLDYRHKIPSEDEETDTES